MGSLKNGPDVQLQTGFGQLTVARFMVSDVQAARPETPAKQSAAMMLEGFGAVPTLMTQRLIGIVTEHDLLTSLERMQNWEEVSAEDIMCPTPIPSDQTPISRPSFMCCRLAI